MASRVIYALLISSFALCGLSASEDLTQFTGAIPPVEIGSNCSDGPPAYYWITRTRTPWAIRELYAVPPNIEHSNSWSYRDEYVQAFVGAIGEDTSLQAYASACHHVWDVYAPGRAKLLIRLIRISTTMHRTVQCLGNIWTESTASIDVEINESEELTAGDSMGYNVAETSVDDLTSILSESLDIFNRQPGADTRPDHEYSVQ